MAVICPDCARHATMSRPKYFIRCTSPSLISSDQATWNHPVGVIDSGGLAMGRNHRAFKVNLEPGRFNHGASRVVMQGPTIRGGGDDESGAVDRCRARRPTGSR